MKAIAKVVLPPPEWCNGTGIYWGKTISTMGMIDFWPEKKFKLFFVRQGFPPFPRGPFLSEQSYILPIMAPPCMVLSSRFGYTGSGSATMKQAAA
jgi:hypothetical protein